MAYDLTTWTPAIGGGGADKYDIAADAKWGAGSASFSGTPTIAEINASSHVNQIIALYNRRAIAQGKTQIAYVAADAKFPLSIITLLQAGINILLPAEGFPTFSFTTPAAQTKPLGTTIGELRRALAITGTQDVPLSPAYVYHRIDNPAFGTPYFEEIAYTSETIGNIAGGGGNYPRYRTLPGLTVPDWIAQATSAAFRFDYTRYGIGDATAYLFHQTGDTNPPVLTPAYNGSAYRVDENLGTATLAAGSVGTAAITIANRTSLIAHAGIPFRMLLGEEQELTNISGGRWAACSNLVMRLVYP